MSLSWIEYVYFEKKDLETGNTRGLKNSSKYTLFYLIFIAIKKKG